MKRRYSLAILAAALAVAGVADAQRGPGGPPIGGPDIGPGMGRGMGRGMGPGMSPGMGPSGGFGLLIFDANNDGKLTRAELDAGLKARFAEADANKDGFVTPEEMRAAMMKRRIEMRFAALDTDHNGQISKAEFEAGMAKLGGPGGGPSGRHPGFGRFGGPDREGGPGMAERGGTDGPGGPGALRGRPGRGAPGAAAAPGTAPDGAGAPRVRRMGPADANGDGKLSFEEFSARAVAEFARADADKNGVVTIAELRALAGAPR